jgi:hypothetical protein
MPQHRDELIPTRASLINRLKDWQDQTSWQEFFDTYWKLVYGVARKAGLTDAESQDVVQITLTAVAKHMPTFQYDRAIGSFKAWLLIKTRWCTLTSSASAALSPNTVPSQARPLERPPWNGWPIPRARH